MTLTAILLSALVFTLWLVKSRQPRSRKQSKSTRGPTRPQSAYHAVAIKAGSCSCAAVKEIKGARYLTNSEVPNLPLPGCNLTNCACRYLHYEDRRIAGSNRRAAYSMQTELYGLDHEKDRRATLGRRASDWATETSAGEDYRDIQWTT